MILSYNGFCFSAWRPAIRFSRFSLPATLFDNSSFFNRAAETHSVGSVVITVKVCSEIDGRVGTPNPALRHLDRAPFFCSSSFSNLLNFVMFAKRIVHFSLPSFNDKGYCRGAIIAAVTMERWVVSHARFHKRDLTEPMPAGDPLWETAHDLRHRGPLSSLRSSTQCVARRKPTATWTSRVSPHSSGHAGRGISAYLNEYRKVACSGRRRGDRITIPF